MNKKFFVSPNHQEVLSLLAWIIHKLSPRPILISLNICLIAQLFLKINRQFLANAYHYTRITFLYGPDDPSISVSFKSVFGVTIITVYFRFCVSSHFIF